MNFRTSKNKNKINKLTLCCCRPISEKDAGRPDVYRGVTSFLPASEKAPPPPLLRKAALAGQGNAAFEQGNAIADDTASMKSTVTSSPSDSVSSGIGSTATCNTELEPEEPSSQQGRVGKNPGLKKKTPAQLFFWFFFVFFVFFGFFFYIFAQKRDILGFFQFQDYF